MGRINKYFSTLPLEDIMVFTFDNDNSLPKNLYGDIVEIYQKQFRRHLNPKDIDLWMRDGYKITVALERSNLGVNDVIAFGRWFIYSELNNVRKKTNYSVYSLYFKLKDFIFISDIASIKRGGGKAIMLDIINKSKELNLPLLLIPWNDLIIDYYRKYGFELVETDYPQLPSKVMIRKPDAVIYPFNGYKNKL